MTNPLASGRGSRRSRSADLAVLASAPVKTGRKERMKEPYTEGVAIHGDPESCVRAREGVGEALTGAGAGWPFSREKKLSRVPTPLARAEGNTCGAASARR